MNITKQLIGNLLLICFIFTILPSNSWAQTLNPPKKHWSFSGKSDYEVNTLEDWFYSIEATSNGQYVASGFTQISENRCKQGHGGHDHEHSVSLPSLAILNSKGEMIHEKAYDFGWPHRGGSFNDVIEVQDGYVAVGVKSNDNCKRRGIFVKIDKNGNTVNKQVINFSNTDKSAFRSVHKTNFGFVVAGRGVKNSGDKQFLLARLSPFGTVINPDNNNAFLFGQSSSDEEARSVEVVKDRNENFDGYIFTGYNTDDDKNITVIRTGQNPNILKAFNTNISMEQFISKNDLTEFTNCSETTVVSGQTFREPNSNDIGFDVKQWRPGGDFFVSAKLNLRKKFDAQCDFMGDADDDHHYQEMDGALLRFDYQNNTSLQWGKVIDFFYSEDLRRFPIEIDRDGIVLLGSKVSGTFRPVKGRLIKTDFTGDIIWERNFMRQGDEANCVFGLDKALDGGYVIGGNNKEEGENYLAIKFYSECQPNACYDITGDKYITGNVTWPDDLSLSSPLCAAQTDDDNNSGTRTSTITVPITVKGQIVIAPGAHLTINGMELEFSDRKRLYDNLQNLDPAERPSIIVLGDGKLTLDDTKLTALSKCGGMWSGIEDDIVSASADIELRNSSVIEHARTGIEANQTTAIDARNSTFKDNLIGVNIGVTHLNNKSTLFKKCTFQSTGPVRDVNIRNSNGHRLGTDKHLKFVRAQNINVEGCTFKNTSSLPYRLRETGIYSIASDFEVNKAGPRFPNPSNTGTISRFIRLAKGIVSSSIRAIQPTTTVKNTRFNKVAQGIVVEGTAFDKVNHNQFKNIPTLQETNGYGGSGVFLVNSSGFEIERNYFHDQYLGYLNRGVIARNTAVMDGILKYNYSNNVSVQFQGEGRNDEFQLRCNTHKDFGYAWYIAGSQMGDQGTGCFRNAERARNAYKDCNNQQKQILSPDANFTYYVNPNNTDHLQLTCTQPSNIGRLCGLTNSEDCAPVDTPCFNTPISNCFQLGTPPPNCEQYACAIQLIQNQTTPIERKLVLNDLIRHMVRNDHVDAALRVLEQRATTEARKVLVPSLILEREFSQARQALNKIPQNNHENRQYHKLFDMIVSHCRNGGNLRNFNAGKLQTIRQVAQDTSTIVCAQAQSLLRLAKDEETHHRPEPLPSWTSNASKKGMEDKGTSKPTRSVQQPKLGQNRPNPFQQKTSISYQVPKKANLCIYNVTGQKLRTYPLEAGKGSITVNKRSLPNGVYIYQLRMSDRVIEERKMIITH